MAKGGGSRQNNSLIKALEGLTDGLYGMFSKRIELARHEVMRDVQRFGILFGILFFCALILVIGYCLLNLALVLAMGALIQGPWAMAATTAGLALAHLIAGGVVAWRSAQRLEEAKQIFLVNRSEFQKDRKWLKEIAATRDAEVPQPGKTLPPATAEAQLAAEAPEEQPEEQPEE